MKKVSEKLRRKSKETQSIAKSAPDAPTGSIIGVDDGKKRLIFRVQNKKAIAIIAVIILVIVVGIVAYRFFADKGETPVDTGGCSPAAVQKAANRLNPGSLDVLRPLAEGMAADSGYEQNPNCLYVLTVYAMNNGDPAAAREYFQKLERVHKPEDTYDESLADDALSLDELRASIEFLEGQQTEIQQNSRGVPIDGE